MIEYGNYHLYKEYFDELKTNFADIQNIGGRYGGAITAAAFLANFTESYKWAHLDIAGTVHNRDKQRIYRKTCKVTN